MPLPPREFAASLAAEVRARRSFGGHTLWHAIARGELTRPQLQRFAQQFFLQVVEFPRAVSALHARCDDLAERRKLAESVYEEETGALSGTKPHPELFLDFACALGLRREEVSGAEALASTTALVHWFQHATQLLSFEEGVAAIQLAAEGQVVGAFGPFARALQKHYGLSQEAVAFWDVHEHADAEHSDVGDSIVVRRAVDDASQARVRRALSTSLATWWEFFEGVGRAVSSS